MQNNFNISIFVEETGNFMRKTFFYSCIIFSFFLISSKVAYCKSKLTEIKEEARISVVVIDPGHGGKDTGAGVGNALEKNIVLDIALKLGNLIKSNYPETKVIYTRDKDVFIPLYKRAVIANKNNADLFISIHANYVNSKYVQGAETFVLGQHRSQDNLEVAKKENSVILLEDDYSTTYEGFDPNSPESYIMFELVQDEYLEQSVMLASVIQDQFRESAKRKDRSVKQAGFLVLRQTTMPSVLVEVGFLNNTSERNYLMSESGRSNMAHSIYTAFEDYKRKIEEKSSFTIVTQNSEENVESINAENPKLEAPLIQSKINEESTNKIYYSVQIAASKNYLKEKPSNFKGERNIFNVYSENIYRYYSGKHTSYNKALEEKKRLQKKFNDAFIVAFENEKLISVKKALGKM